MFSIYKICQSNELNVVKISVDDQVCWMTACKQKQKPVLWYGSLF